jgi:hypothetical protein
MPITTVQYGHPATVLFQIVKVALFPIKEGIFHSMG